MAAEKQKVRGVRLVVVILLWPVFALWGALILLTLPLRILGWLLSALAAMRRTITCPQGHPNPTVGRFVCSRCKAEYLGWIGRCAVCGAGAGWTPCVVCASGVRFPWVRA